MVDERHEPASGASVWICLPTYNEKENLERMVAALLEEFDVHEIDGHILVVDDNSPDGTGAIADRLAADTPRVEVLHRTAKEGLGRAYLHGFSVALSRGADLVMEMDCDFSHNPHDVHRLVAAAERADLVLGSRNIPEGGVRNWPWYRRLLSRGGSLYARMILGLSVRDLTGGFKCFRREVLENLDLERITAQGYAFQIELTYRTIQAGYSVVEIPIVFVDREAGTSKMSTSIMFEAMLQVWRLRFSAPQARIVGSD